MSVISIALNEWARLFLSKRGWIAIIAFALIWAIFLMYVIAPAARYISSQEVGLVLGSLLARFGANALNNWQSTEMALYWAFALYVLPFFTMISAADQIASDKARGTLRFLILRASRTSVFFGRFIGQYLIQLFIIIVTMASVLALIGYHSAESLTDALPEVPVVFVNMALVLMPYVALMALVSVIAQSAKQATLFAIIGWIVLWFVLGYVQNNFGPFPILDWVLPGSQLGSLVRLSGWDTLNLAPIPLLHTVVLLGLGWFAMNRSDL